MIGHDAWKGIAFVFQFGLAALGFVFLFAPAAIFLLIVTSVHRLVTGAWAPFEDPFMAYAMITLVWIGAVGLFWFCIWNVERADEVRRRRRYERQQEQA